MAGEKTLDGKRTKVQETDGCVRSVDETDVENNLKDVGPSPSEIMRSRHPDLFSDSRVGVTHQLSRATFEHYLDTLTSRKQEYQFEHFCRKLAEREICPNLRLQTGPTGGGDSQVDSETLPVAQEVSERWWVGSPSAGSERWAFAFSAKERWKPKLKADVEKIVATDRGYSRIYFFTSRFARDKDRATCEDDLRESLGVPVHVVDRSWIVEKVYAGDQALFAGYCAALGLDDVRTEERSEVGPRDTERLRELELLDSQIADPSRYVAARYQLVEDCLRSAVLARGLERPRTEVEGRFGRAARLADEVDHRQQRLRVAYDRAWTAFWWYEDYGDFGRQYDVVEELATASDVADDASLLVNLWMLLVPSVAKERIGAGEAKVKRRFETLRELLRSIVADVERPNNALEARTSLVLIRTAFALQTDRMDDVESGWRELADVVDSATGLGSYSVERLFRLVKELGDHVESSAFDELYEKLANTMGVRRSDGEAGIAYLQRGRQKLLQGRAYDAIGWFGRAEELLVKDEYRQQLHFSLIGQSCALEEAGLLWAARNKALASVDMALVSLHETGKMWSRARVGVSRLVWCELRLGRPLHGLYAMFLSSFVASRSKLADEEVAAYAEELERYELLLGVLFLRLDLTALAELTRLPAALERLELWYARAALLFALGDETTLREEGFIAAGESFGRAEEFFADWVKNARPLEAMGAPVLVFGETTSLRSRILGVEVLVETPNNAVSFGVAESLLGALEAFLATSHERSVFPYIERLDVAVAADAEVEQLATRFGDGSDCVRILHGPEVAAGLQSRLAYRDSLLECIAKLAPRMLVIKNPFRWLEELVGQERGLSRAVLFGDCVSMNDGVLADFSLVTPQGWVAKDDQEYRVLRDRPWWSEERKVGEEGPPGDGISTGLGEPAIADARRERARLRHTDLRVLSPIDVPLWNRAKWRGVLVFAREGWPPVLALGFEDYEAGRLIFRAWRERFGAVDRREALRVVIVRGVSRRNPAEYGISIGPSFRPGSGEAGKAFYSVSRIQRMTPQTSESLDRFLGSYSSVGGYVLTPAPLVGVEEAQEALSDAIDECGISKHALEVRQAWEIGENDPDSAMLFKGDEPIIPEGEEDPPILAALRRRFGAKEEEKG